LKTQEEGGGELDRYQGWSGSHPDAYGRRIGKKQICK
jgi:hypothetical protein